MSATEQMRAMLDGLMGTARDGSDSQKQHLHFTDPRVCRAFLLDCCPHDIFASTKLELGDCSKVHDPALRADYLNANKVEDYMYEISALERLQTFVNEADRKTENLKRSLAKTQENLTAEETSKLNRVHDLTELLGKKLAQIDKAEQDGDLEAKEKLSDEAEKIKKERVRAEEEYRKVSKPVSSHQQQNLRVCDICSAYLGINDNDSRLADHFGGKLHLGFITVREKLDDLKKIVAEKKASRRSNHISQNDSYRDRDRFDRGSGASDRDLERRSFRSRDRDIDYDSRSRDYDRDYDRHSRQMDYDRYRDRDRDYERGSGRGYRDHPRDNRYRERERSRSSGRYYREPSRESRPRDRYRDDRIDGRIDGRSETRYQDRPDRNDSVSRGAFERLDGRFQDREITYRRRLREWEKREAEKARKYAIRLSEERDRKQLEEQESMKLKEFLEDYKDDRDDIRFYRGSALARRLADRRKEIEQDEMARQKEKVELEILSRSCNNSNSQAIECANELNEINDQDTRHPEHPTMNGDNCSDQHQQITNDKTQETNSVAVNPSSTSSKQTPIQNKTSTTSEDKRRQVEELIGRIPTDKDQLFARKLDWALLDENLMEKRIRPWVTKKIAEYMGEKEVDLIDFVCTLLNAHTDGYSMLREVAIVLDDEAEKFVVHMWRLLIFEIEAKKIGLRK